MLVVSSSSLALGFPFQMLITNIKIWNLERRWFSGYLLNRIPWVFHLVTHAIQKQPIRQESAPWASILWYRPSVCLSESASELGSILEPVNKNNCEGLYEIITIQHWFLFFLWILSKCANTTHFSWQFSKLCFLAVKIIFISERNKMINSSHIKKHPISWTPSATWISIQNHDSNSSMKRKMFPLEAAGEASNETRTIYGAWECQCQIKDTVAEWWSREKEETYSLQCGVNICCCCC